MESLPFLGLLGAGMIHQDSPHNVGGCGKKVCAAPPIHFSQLRQAKIRVVNQSRRLQSVVNTLST